MRHIPYQRYNTEFLDRVDKSRVYFNPDNSVVLLDHSDEDIFGWLKENGAKLKETGFFLNDETAGQIREYLRSQQTDTPSAEPIKEKDLSVKNEEDLEKFAPAEVALPPAAKNLKASKEKQKILDELKKARLSVAQLAKILERAVKLIP